MEGVSPEYPLSLQWIKNKIKSKNTGPSLRVALGLLTSTEPSPACSQERPVQDTRS